jgi:hypothetical protein
MSFSWKESDNSVTISLLGIAKKEKVFLLNRREPNFDICK